MKIYPELAEEEMKKEDYHMPEPAVISLLKLFPGGLKVKAIAAGLGWKVHGTRPYLTRLKKQGRITNPKRGLWKVCQS